MDPDPDHDQNFEAKTRASRVPILHFCVLFSKNIENVAGNRMSNLTTAFGHRFADISHEEFYCAVYTYFGPPCMFFSLRSIGGSRDKFSHWSSSGENRVTLNGVATH